MRSYKRSIFSALVLDKGMQRQIESTITRAAIQNHLMMVIDVAQKRCGTCLMRSAFGVQKTGTHLWLSPGQLLWWLGVVVCLAWPSAICKQMLQVDRMQLIWVWLGLLLVQRCMLMMYRVGCFATHGVEGYISWYISWYIS